ncbi:hypothetical protein [Fibrobacter sp.]|uniref:hypothetical protein n=1 Tax=Fibrobacter sp. TaxID=35828 RepID=UPI0025B8EB86|nr:hypothetical protein [Fibrobacter sp.]MBR3073624.1 hypothetical protein [Fibrobacter sp.]
MKIKTIRCPYCWKLVLNPFNVFPMHCEVLATGEQYIELWHKDCAKLYAEEMESED